nr:hypothetical protein [Stenotrophomonas acidaminiphila]
MDSSEIATKELLVHMGFTDIAYEPDGNVPPDFVINGGIAVEVRRLNQNFDDGSGARGLEEVTYPLWQKMTRLVESIAETNGVSWFVFFRFSRPAPPWKEIELQLRGALLEFTARADKRRMVVLSLPNFEVEVAEASNSLETFFCMGGMSDRQAGGWVVSEFIANIEHCASEKLRKTLPFRDKYKSWWLALTNFTGMRLDEKDQDQLRQHLPSQDGWDKILLINPHSPTDWIEL